MKKTWKKIGFLLFSALLIVALFYGYGKQTKTEYTKNTILMDTVITLRASGKNAKPALEESMKRLQEIDKMASTTNADSDISKVNQAAGIKAVNVSSEIIRMVQMANQYSKLTDGAFDITIGPIVDLWGIGTDQQKVPSDIQIKEKLALVDYNNIVVDDKAKTLYLTKIGMKVDLGGVAKGFAADEVIKIYKKYGITDGLISLGSSTVYALGKNEEDENWTVGIMNPRDEKSDHYLGILDVSNEMISTSGDYERYFIKDGKRYFHIFDPKTGYPAESNVMSTTVVMNQSVKQKGMLSDILSSAVLVMGEEKGIKFLENIKGVSGEMTTTDKKVYTTKDFGKRIENLNKDYQMQ